WARFSEAKAGLTGTGVIARARATSSGSSPERSGPNRIALRPGCTPMSRAAASGVSTGFVTPRLRTVVAKTFEQSATASAVLSNMRAFASTSSAPEAAGPAAGLGQPSRGATSRISVSPKLSMARAALPMFSPSCGRTRTIAGASVPADIAHAAGEFLEIPRFGEVAIDRGEADVGDRIQLAQALHHHLPDPRRRHFAFACGFNLALDAGDELVEPLLRYSALAA